jgi:CheY-like chemotaxis protein
MRATACRPNQQAFGRQGCSPRSAGLVCDLRPQPVIVADSPFVRHRAFRSVVLNSEQEKYFTVTFKKDSIMITNSTTNQAPRVHEEPAMRRSRRQIDADNARMLKQRRRTILCIDDDVVGSTLRQALLQRAGYRVLIAASGTQGLEMAKRHRVDLVLVDFALPDLNGFSVAALLRGIHSTKRVVMLSGNESKAPVNFRELDGFISKKTRVDRFLTSVARHLHR